MRSPSSRAARARHIRLASALLISLTGCLSPTVPGGTDSGGTGGDPVGFDHLATLTGTVSDGTGSPLSGALVVTDPRGYEATTDAAGAWTIGLLPPDSYSVVAKSAGLAAATSAQVEVEGGQTATVDLVLDQTEATYGVVTVTVLGPDDLPLEGATLTASTGETALTDSAGTASLTGVEGTGLSFTVSAEGMWSRTLSGQDLGLAGGLQWATQLSGKAPDDAAYIGSEICSLCHAETGAAFAGTRHARALDAPVTDTLLATFEAGQVVDLGRATATLGLDGDSPTVTLIDRSGASLVLSVDGWIADPEQASVPYTDLGSQAWPLPLGWLAGDPARGSYPDAQPRWVPYETERWLTSDGDLDLVDGSPDPASSAEAQCLPCHATGYTLSLRSDGGVDMASTGVEGRWFHAGVGCEHCHGPGEEHLAVSTDDKPFTVTKPQHLDRDRANEVCAQCHSRTEAHGTGLPHPFLSDAGTYRTGATLSDYAASVAEHWPSGAAKLSRMQADELDLSSHGPGAAYGFRCFDCHDPHGASADTSGDAHRAMLRLSPDDNSLCLTCHQDMDFDGDLALVEDHAAHGSYTPDTSYTTGRCTNCHMPGVATGLAWSELSGAGDHASHTFDFLPPQDTVDAFDDAGATSLPVGDFPVHGCADCHAYVGFSLGLFGIEFDLTGDPTLRETHVRFQDAVDEVWP